jgi:hypothetical protein
MGVPECRRLGCETQWVKICSEQEKFQVTHLYSNITCCISLEIIPQNWVCEACEASGTSRGMK